MKTLLGLDIGTSSTKAILVTPKGEVIGEASSPHPLHSPQPGWNEQDPEDWWRASSQAVNQVLKNSHVPPESIAAIGLSGQMHGSVFLDARGNVLRNALLWNDQRTQAECELITRLAGGERALIRMVSNVALTGYTAPKILWLKRHEPKVFRKLAKVILPKDYVRFRLTGKIATDFSDASGTLLLDVKKRKWSKELLRKIKLSDEILPPVLESSEVAGFLTSFAARALGLKQNIPIATGAGDQAAAAVGMGIVSRGKVSATIGTSGVVFAHSDRAFPNQQGLLQSFCHAVPKKWCVFGCMLSAGGSLEWLKQNFFSEQTSFAEILREAEKSSTDLFFLPYLDGERCPHPDPNARGAWIGLSRKDNMASMTRAVMEGVTFGMAEQIELLRQAKIPVQEVRLAGGGAKSSLWAQLQTDVYNCATAAVNTEEASALGAAILAGVGAKVWPSVEKATEKILVVRNRLKPRSQMARAFGKKLSIYSQFYPALKHLFFEMVKSGQEKK